MKECLDSVETEKFPDPSNIKYVEESGFTCLVYLCDHLQLASIVSFVLTII